jgi:glycerol-3-phosphate O-acyltransferase
MSLPTSLLLLAAPLLRLRRPVLLLSETLRTEGRRVNSLNRLKAVCQSMYLKEVQIARGVPFEVPSQVVIHSLSGKEYNEALQSLAQTLGFSASKTHRLVSTELKKIASRPRAWAYIPAAYVAGLLTKRLFSAVRTHGLENIRSASAQGTPVIVPLHRSHLDYVVISLAMYNANFIPPLIAAGVNLNFWPFGPIARSLGAFFVRRGSRGAQVHKLALESYLKYVIRRGHSLKFYIEGGRSRSGKMRAPRLGMLSTIAIATTKKLRRDVLVIPTTVTYERVIEDSSLAAENAGMKKARENLINLFRARKVLGQRYGEVEVRFGTPISMRNFLDDADSEGKELDQKLPGFGRKIVQEIRRGTSLTQAALESTALLMAPHYGMEASELRRVMTNLVMLADIINDTVPACAGRSESLNMLLAQPGAEQKHSESVEQSTFFKKSVLYIPGNKRFLAEFYKNSCVHIFSHLSLLAIEELLHGHFKPADVAVLHPFFQYDLQLPSSEEFIAEAEHICAALVGKRLLHQKGDYLQFSSREMGIFNPLLLYPQVEAYAFMLGKLHHLCQLTGTQRLSHQEIQSSALEDARSGKYLSILTRTESSSQSTLEILLPSLEQMGIVQREFEHGSLAAVRVLCSSSDLRHTLGMRLASLISWESQLRLDAVRQQF